MKEHRSFFWPLTFIAAGVIWLLITMNVIPAANLWALTHIWPFLLIALGVGLILRSIWRPFGLIVSALVVFGAVAAVFFAPQLGWADAPSWGDWGDWTMNGASGGGGVRGSGVMKEETRPVEDFDAVSIRFPAEVVIRQGKTEALTIEADNNLLPQLSTKVRSGTLVIENTEGNWAKRVTPTSVQITITVKNLKSVHFSTAGTLLVDGLTADELELNISGAAEVTLSDVDVINLDVNLSGAGSVHANGVADDVQISISGLGDFQGEELSCQTADIEISGAGSATLRVAKELNAEVSGAGTVNYYGNPEVSKRISGAGAVNRMGD